MTMSVEELRARLAAAEYPFGWGIDKTVKRRDSDSKSESDSDSDSDSDEPGSSVDDDDDHPIRENDEGNEEPDTGRRIIIDVYNRFCRCLAGFTYDLIHCNVSSAEDCIAKSITYLEMDGPIVNKYKPALLNIVWACCAHLSLERENLKEAEQFLDKIIPLDDIQQAAIWGTCCSLLSLNGMEGKQEAGKYAMKAYEANKNEDFWSFLLGCNKADLRRSVYPLSFPSDEEIELLQLAYDLDNSNAKYAAYLGRSYNDCGLVLYNKNPKDPAVEVYNRKAYDLHRKAIALNKGESALVSLICARGLCRLPKTFNCLDEAAKVMIEAFERSKLTREVPRPLFYHYLGLLSLKKQKFIEAAEYLLMSFEFGCVEAAWAYIGVMLRLNPLFDPKDIYAKLLSNNYGKLVGKRLMVRTHVHAFCCYLLLKRDLLLAVNHFIPVADSIQNNPGIIQSHYEGFSQWVFKRYSKVDPVSVLCNEVRLALEEGQFPDEKEIFEQALEHLKRIVPDEFEKPVVHNILQMLSLNDGQDRQGRNSGEWSVRGGWNNGRGGRGRGWVRGRGGNTGMEHNRVRIRENRTRVSRFSESSSTSHGGYMPNNLDRTRNRTRSECSVYSKEPVTNWRTEDRSSNTTNYNWHTYKLKQQNENWRQEDDNRQDHQNVGQYKQDFEN